MNVLSNLICSTFVNFKPVAAGCFLLLLAGWTRADHLTEYHGELTVKSVPSRSGMEYRACDLIPATVGFRLDYHELGLPLSVASDQWAWTEMNGAWTDLSVSNPPPVNLDAVDAVATEGTAFRFASYRKPGISAADSTSGLPPSNTYPVESSRTGLSLFEAVPPLALEPIEFDPVPKAAPMTPRTLNPWMLVIKILLPPTLTVGSLLYWRTLCIHHRSRYGSRRQHRQWK